MEKGSESGNLKERYESLLEEIKKFHVRSMEDVGSMEANVIFITHIAAIAKEMFVATERTLSTGTCSPEAEALLLRHRNIANTAYGALIDLNKAMLELI